MNIAAKAHDLLLVVLVNEALVYVIHHCGQDLP